MDARAKSAGEREGGLRTANENFNNQSERLAAESTEAGKRGQATADARQTSCRVSWREKS